MLYQQYTERGKGLLRQLPGGAKADLLLRGAKVLTHNGVRLPQPRRRKGAAEGGRGLGAPGEEEHRRVCHALRHRVAGAAVGGHQFPVLPWSAKGGAEELYAGYAGDDPCRQPKAPQQGQQSGCPGVEAGVPAVQDRRFPDLSRAKGSEDILRFVQRQPVVRAALRQLCQQALCPQDQVCSAQGGFSLGGKKAGGACPHSYQCDHNSISLQRTRI